MKILAVAGDAGGARALTPVIRRLVETNTQVECRAYLAAAKIWQDENLAVELDISGAVSKFDAILLGTTVSKEQVELEIIRQAKEANIPTVSVLDFWTNYRERFASADGEFVLPTAIAVMDERARSEMIELEFPPEILHITGQPAFDDLTHYLTAEKSKEKIGSGGDEAEITITYVSQPLSQLYSRAELGFDEEEVFRDVAVALDAILERRGRRGLLSLKLHPREAEKNYDVAALNSPFLKIIVADAFDNPRRAVQNSDFVIGMNSILLMEACYLEKPVISYQPNLRISDALPSNKSGWSRAVYRREDLAAALEKELFDDETRRRRERILQAIPKTFDAARRVADLISRISKIKL